MASSKLKICKVESKSFAKYCIMRGTDYLGIHVLEFKRDKHTQELCQYIQEKGGRAVLLTKERSIEKLRQLMEYYQPWGIQLHYSVSVSTLTILQQRLDIPLIPVFTSETDVQAVRQLVETSEFAIYDTSFRGGTGATHSAQHLAALGNRLRQKVLLAGGIDPAKIREMRDKVGGFDVQSYCRVNRQPHYGRFERLARTLKGTPRCQLSVSLTDLGQEIIKPPYVEGEALEYQLDFSEGNLYSEFKVDKQHVDEILRTEDAPFTLHIFEKSPEAFQRVIDYYQQLAGPKLVRINIQYSPGLDLNSITTYDAQLCLSLYYGDTESYELAHPRMHECLSLILPSELPRKREYLHSHSDFIRKIARREVWFDRKVDDATIQEVLRHDDSANFIVGKFVLSDWSNEVRLTNILKNTHDAA